MIAVRFLKTLTAYKQNFWFVFLRDSVKRFVTLGFLSLSGNRIIPSARFDFFKTVTKFFSTSKCTSCVNGTAVNLPTVATTPLVPSFPRFFIPVVNLPKLPPVPTAPAVNCHLGADSIAASVTDIFFMATVSDASMLNRTFRKINL